MLGCWIFFYSSKVRATWDCGWRKSRRLLVSQMMLDSLVTSLTFELSITGTVQYDQEGWRRWKRWVAISWNNGPAHRGIKSMHHTCCARRGSHTKVQCFSFAVFLREHHVIHAVRLVEWVDRRRWLRRLQPRVQYYFYSTLITNLFLL